MRVSQAGDVIHIIDESGSIVTTYTYSAFGEVLSVTGTLASTIGARNPFRYRSYYYDTETGWYYLNSRYYDPTVGRFINADGIIGANGGIVGYNMFAYCNNNPIMYADPNGESLLLIVGITYFAMDIIQTMIVYNDLINMGFDNITFASARDCRDTLKRNEIDTAEEKAHFFSQCYVEGNLSLLEAGWLTEEAAENYRRQQRYYPYYGAGYIQLTWEDNYRAFSEYMNDPKIYSEGPKYVAQNYAWSVAGWFWMKRGINEEIANGADVSAVTRMVNGGYNGLDERTKYYNEFITYFGG